MAERKELGRIQKANFGYGGYQDVMIGLSVTLGGPAWGVHDFRGDWGIDRTEHSKWSEDDRLISLGRAVLFLRDLLKTAKRTHVSELVGLPIEATFDGNRLVSWRLLEECLP